MPPEKTAAFLSKISDPNDWYITPNEFHKGRTIASLSALRSCWVDIDNISSFDEVKRRIENIPPPSLITSTGGGFHIYWFIKSEKKVELALWNMVQKVLVQEVDGDRNATDAARVLRLVGTMNSKYDKECVFVSGSLEYFDLYDLAHQVLPDGAFDKDEDVEETEPAQVYSMPLERIKRNKTVSSGTFDWRINELGAARIWEGRLNDLKALAQHRWNNNIKSGHRDIWLFLASNAISWLAPPSVLKREVEDLASQVCPTWNQVEINARIQAVFKRAEQFAKGEKVIWNEKEIDPRYRFKTDTIIDLLEISEEEMRILNLRHLKNDNVRKEHDKARKMKKRRGEGVIERSVYLNNCSQKQSLKILRAKELQKQGHSVQEIASCMGYDKSTIYRLLKP